MDFFRDRVNTMQGYKPGEQPAPGTRLIKLNTNENPYPPSPAAMQILQNFDGELLRRYPDPTAKSFREAASQVLGIPADWILVGNGSDDMLTMIFRACAEPKRRVVCPFPTYVLYKTLCQIQDAEFIEVPFDDDYTLPVDELVAAEGTVTFVASPNSPSGTAFSNNLLDELASRLKGLLVIDEAYADFAEDNAIALTQKHDNVIVLRTLSKGYSLAGLRLGFGIANPTLLAGLMKVKDSYNIDALACAIGTAAIADQDYKNANADRVKASRTKLADRLEQLGFQIWPSQTNFLLARPPKGNAEEIYQSLKERGILVRYFNQSRLDDKLRITVGTDEQNDLLLELLASM